jgi:hypothetical protein
MYEVLKDFQVLIASILALGAAGIGFTGVWYTQKKTLENAERERKHREAMEHSGVQRGARHTIETVASGLSGELSSLYGSISNTVGNLRVITAMYKGIADEGSVAKLEIESKIALGFDTPVFDAYVDKLGALPPSLVYSTVEIYLALKLIDRNPFVFPKPAYVKAISLGYQTLAKTLEHLSPRIQDTIMRLHAVRLGHPDPGIGKGEEFWKARGAPEQFGEDVSTAPSPQPAL